MIAAGSFGSANRYVTVIWLCGTPQRSTVSARRLSTRVSIILRFSSCEIGFSNFFPRVSGSDSPEVHWASVFPGARWLDPFHPERVVIPRSSGYYRETAETASLMEKPFDPNEIIANSPLAEIPMIFKAGQIPDELLPKTPEDHAAISILQKAVW